jgi:integrase
VSPKRRQRGTGSLYQRGDGMWVGAVNLGFGPDGKIRRKTVSSKDYTTAARKLRDLMRQVDSGHAVATTSPTVKVWMQTWLDDVAFQRVRPRTLDTYRGYVDRYILPTLGKRRLDQVQPQHVRAMHKAITDAELSSTTARQAHAILARAFKDARRDGHPCIDIADRMDPPKVEATEREVLTTKQAVTLVHKTAERDRDVAARWWFALLYGVRQGERLGLEWDRIDFENGSLDITWQLQRLPYVHGCNPPCGRKRAGNCPERLLKIPAGYEVREAPGGLWLTRPKSRAGQRQLPLIHELAVILQALPRRGPLVFCREDGRGIEPSDDNAAWHASLDAAGLPSVSLHAARHTTATLLRDLGVPRETIQQIIGHSSALTTDLYIHGDDPLRRAALEGVGRQFALGDEAAGH